MKPNFALSLGHDGIALLHRGKTGWRALGSVALEDPELAARMAMLRKTAVSLEAGGMAVKVLIPDSQILYTEIDSPEMSGPDGAEPDPAAAIGRCLVGLTPYALHELAFDWRRLGSGRIRLALVARDTLDEAEAFAREHRFNPVAFAAAPDPEAFPGEPFFGPAASAAALLEDLGPIEPDADALDLGRLLAADAADVSEYSVEVGAEQAGTEEAATTAPGERAPAAGPERTATGPVPDQSVPNQSVPDQSVPDHAASANPSAPPQGEADAASPEPSPAPAPADESPDAAPAALAGAMPSATRPEAPPQAPPQAQVLSLRRAPGPDSGSPDSGGGLSGGPGGGRADPPDLPRGPDLSQQPDLSRQVATGFGLADAIGAISGEQRRMPTFASRRSAATGSRAGRIEPSLTGPARREPESEPKAGADAGQEPLPVSGQTAGLPGPVADRGTPEAAPAPRLVASRGTGANATGDDTPRDDLTGDAPTGDDLTGAARDDGETAGKIAAESTAAPLPSEGPAPESPVAASRTDRPAAQAAPDTDAADAGAPDRKPAPRPGPISAPATGERPADPPVLRRLPPIPPRAKPAAAAPGRRAPVINFGPKRAAKAAGDASARAVPDARSDSSASGPEAVQGPAPGADDLTIFGAQKPLALPLAQRRGSPAVVVVMTLILLAGLAGLALWSTFWPDDAAEVSASVALEPSPALPASPQPGADPAPGVAPELAPEFAPEFAPVLTEAQAAEPELAGPDPAPALDPALALAAADPVLPGDPAISVDLAQDLAGLPLDPGAVVPPVERAALAVPPGEGAAEGFTLPAALDPGIADAAGPDDADVLALDAGPDSLIDDEALADGEREALLDPVSGGGAAGVAEGEAGLAGDAADQAAAGAAVDPLAPEAAVAALADPPAPVPDTPLLPDDPVTELVGTDEGAAERVAAQLLEALTPEVAEARYAETGIWVLPPAPLPEPGHESLDDLYVAAIDTQIAGEDAVALPEPQRDAVLLTQLPPPPAGTRFDFDERGLVRAVPEGALNPDGVAIYLGKPALVPAPRPGSADAAAEAAAPAVPGAEPAEGAAPAPDGAPAAPLIRPKPRPEDLTELNEKATLGGRTRVELAGLRPRQRPEVIEKLALAAQLPDAETVDAVAEAANAAVAQVALELAPATKLAVKSSRLPQPKPGNIETLAAAAVVAPRPAAPDPGQASGGGHVDEDDGEPVLAAAVMPKLPTKAAVAKTATVSNAINLSKINLIGVYGSSASRRALVRMPNGKYVKVQVGDRLDGGKVAAIGEAELIYVKGNKQHRLQMPSKA